MKTWKWLAIAVMTHVALIQVSQAAPITIQTSTNPAEGWRTIAPVGNLEGLPLSEVGLDWEASNVGWNTELAFDDSAGAGWHSPVFRDVSVFGATSTNNIWSDGTDVDGNTPAYFRRVFALNTRPASAHFGGSSDPITDYSNVIDDDALIYINGALVLEDRDGFATTFPLTNVTEALHAGENLIAVKAHDSFGAFEHFSLVLRINEVPEPGSPLLFMAILMLLGFSRRSARAHRQRQSTSHAPAISRHVAAGVLH